MLCCFLIFTLLGSLKELWGILLRLLLPYGYKIRMHSIECCKLLYRLFSLDRLNSYLRLEFLVLVFAHSERKRPILPIGADA